MIFYCVNVKKTPVLPIMKEEQEETQLDVCWTFSPIFCKKKKATLFVRVCMPLCKIYAESFLMENKYKVASRSNRAKICLF